MVLLDTCILIEIINGEAPLLDHLTELRDRGEILSTTIINVAELYYGAKLSRRIDQFAKIKKFLEMFHIYEFSEECSVLYAEIKSQLKRMGNMIGELDIIIASIAKRHNETLLTRDQHFANIQDLTLYSNV
jgi:tRNA(fMet)-specific endonuclease VapC